MDIIEGRNPVIEALRAKRPLEKILIVRNIERHSAIAEIISLARARDIPVEYVPRQTLDRESSSASHQGVIAFAAAKEYITLDALLAISIEKNEPPLYLILDGIEDPQNLGSVLRTADAAGLHGVIIRSRRAVGLTAAVARASAGALEYVPVVRVNNIAQTVDTLKKNNIWIVGVDPAGGEDYTKIDLRPPTAIVIGSEGKGISALVKEKCDFLAFIPMRGKISSLNASIAAALVMYEAYRQRSNLRK